MVLKLRYGFEPMIFDFANLPEQETDTLPISPPRLVRPYYVLYICMYGYMCTSIFAPFPAAESGLGWRGVPRLHLQPPIIVFAGKST